MENTEVSSKVLNNPKNQVNWLQIAEYTALGGSVCGSGLAWLFEQVLFAAIPITLALVLNTMNRKIFEEKIQKHSHNEIEELKTDINSVCEQLEVLPKTITEATPNSLVNVSPNQSNFEYNTVTKEDWEAINIKFSDIDEQLQLLEDLTTDLQQQALVTDLQPQNQTYRLNEIEKLQAQITKLQEQNRDIVKPYLIRIIRAVKQLEKTIKY